MAKLLKLRRGTTTQHGSFTGAEGEVTVDTDKETLVVHDGSTAGGHPVAAEDMANVSSASIAGRLGTDSIATSKIAAGALPTDVTIASANIVNGTIATDDIGGQQITTAKIADDAVTAAKIAAGAVGQTEIATGGVDATELAADAVRAVKIQDGAVISSKIAADAVNGTKIADDSINSEHYVDGSIDTAHIADDAVTQAKMADNAIGTSQLANNAVYTAAIQDNGVVEAKIANNAVTNAKIASGISSSKLTGALPAIDGSNLTGIQGIPSGVIMMWSGAINAIPSGFVLCNGQNNTPNLIDRFIVGAGSVYSVGDTGGASSVTLSINEIPSHSHTVTTRNSQGGGVFTAMGHARNTGSVSSSNASGLSNTGGGAAHENRPPYYALCYIMKT